MSSPFPLKRMNLDFSDSVATQSNQKGPSRVGDTFFLHFSPERGDIIAAASSRRVVSPIPISWLNFVKALGEIE